MNRPIIEFAPPSIVAESQEDPWNPPKFSKFQDLILKPEFAARNFRFPVGPTWVRIVPALRGGRNWLLPVKALKYTGGRHAHGTKRVFDIAFRWCQSNQPESLRSIANPKGYKLLADPFRLLWILVEVEGKPVARLVIANGYDGLRGGAGPGLGHQLWSLPRERDENGALPTDPVDPEAGLQVCVIRIQPTGAPYPNYKLRLGHQAAPIQEIFARMDPDELAALRPLEEVVFRPDEEEEWKLLEKVIDPDTVARIRSEQS